MSDVINGFWILVSAILGLSAIVLSACGIWKALEMKDEDEQRTKANREIANREKEMKDLRFDGMSLFEMTMTTGRLLREDKKRRAKKRGYAV